MREPVWAWREKAARPIGSRTDPRHPAIRWVRRVALPAHRTAVIITNDCHCHMPGFPRCTVLHIQIRKGML